jgi:membrane-associated phospholipid phosphatase
MRMRIRSVPPWLIVVTLIATAAFIALTVIVTTNSSLAFDSRAFAIASDLREPWVTTLAHVVTTLGLIAVVGPAGLVVAGVLIALKHRPRAAALVAGGALAWVTVWITKSLVDRPRPPRPLVHTTGQSYPSAHAANSVGWLALAIALSVIIPARGARIAVIAAGALVALFVGLSRVYLRAHFASDVLAGYALAVAMYSIAAIVMIARPHAAQLRTVEPDDTRLRRASL